MILKCVRIGDSVAVIIPKKVCDELKIDWRSHIDATFKKITVE